MESSNSSKQIYERKILLCHEKALSSFSKRGRGRDVFNQGLAQPTSDNNPSVHALLSANIQLLVRPMCSTVC